MKSPYFNWWCKLETQSGLCCFICMNKFAMENMMVIVNSFASWHIPAGSLVFCHQLSQAHVFPTSLWAALSNDAFHLHRHWVSTLKCYQYLAEQNISLRSELVRQHSVRDLSIDFSINMANPPKYSPHSLARNFLVTIFLSGCFLFYCLRVICSKMCSLL